MLAERAAEGRLTVKDLLLYSAVCGTGLDTVPLPGDVTSGQIAALLLDISALALRLDKPLTARLMPVPGKQAGDMTSFNFGYFRQQPGDGAESGTAGEGAGGNGNISGWKNAGNNCIKWSGEPSLRPGMMST